MERLGPGDPRWIGGYRLLGRLGEGGMGRVYLARSERGRTVAVKAVKAELAQHAEFRRRFSQEITAARRVGDAWTAPVLDADTEAAEPWVATGYIAGPSLSQVVDEDYGPLPEHSVRALATGLIKALSAIHGAGLIHRDLKPSNILITFDGPRVIDFGIARAVDAALQSSGGLTSAGAVIGSPGFMSPEQVRGETVTTASDVFCLGAVLAYAATGRMPFGSADSGVHALLFRIVDEDPDLTGLSGPLYELTSGCLAKDPARRPTLEALAARTQGEISGTWLPGEVLAQLGRHAVQLLDSEDPEAQAAALGGSVPGNLATAPPVTPHGPGSSTPVPSVASTPPPAYRPGAYGYPYPQPPPQPQGWLAPGTPTGYQSPAFAPPNGRTPPRPARSPRVAATTTVALLGAVLLWMLVDLIVHFIAFEALSDTPESYAPREDADFTVMRTASQVMAVLGGILGGVTVVMYLIWFWRVRVNAEAFAPGRIRYAPGTAIGAWFVPLCNVFMPKQIINDIWAASGTVAAGPWYGGPRPPGARRGLLNAWWTMWITYVVLGSIFAMDNWYESTTLNDALGWIAVGLFGDMLGMPAGLLALVVVLKLTRFQEDRLAGGPR